MAWGDKSIVTLLRSTSSDGAVPQNRFMHLSLSVGRSFPVGCNAAQDDSRELSWWIAARRRSHVGVPASHGRWRHRRDHPPIWASSRGSMLEDPVAGQTGLVSHPMNHKGVEFVLLARPGRDRWTLVISYPRSANPTEMRFDGSRDEAIAAAVARIEDRLKRQRATEKRAPSLPRADR
jgi:hypothetical protein